jgi:hypothetical protein
MVRQLVAAAILAASVIGVTGPATVFAQGTVTDHFVPGFEDLPLMPGLEVVPESGLVFDKPHGRIVETVVTGAVRRHDVDAFYAETLPQLGWSALGKQSYRREGEILRIEYGGEDQALTVRFFLSPS